jgi:hypothetical protein
VSSHRAIAGLTAGCGGPEAQRFGVARRQPLELLVGAPGLVACRSRIAAAHVLRSPITSTGIRDAIARHRPQSPGGAEGERDETCVHQEGEGVEGERGDGAHQARGSHRLSEIADRRILGSVSSSPSEKRRREEIRGHDEQPEEPELDHRQEVLVVEEQVARREKRPWSSADDRRLPYILAHDLVVAGA